MDAALVQYGIPLAAVLVFLSSVGVPTGVPIKVVLIAVGSAVVRTPAELLAAFVVLVAAEWAGIAALFFGARAGGSRLPRQFAAAEAKARGALADWRARLGNRDAAAMFVLRLIPVVRIGVTAGAGAFGVRGRDVALGAMPAAGLWIGVPLGLGWLFREDIQRLEAALAGAIGPSLVVLALLLAVAGAIVFVRRGRPIPVKPLR
jgi:membrane protein DedA with SNARE-associated domain